MWVVAAILYSYTAFYSPYKHPPNPIFGSHQTGVSRGEKSKSNKGKQNPNTICCWSPPQLTRLSQFVNKILWWRFQIIAMQQLLLHFKLVNVMSASFPNFYPHGHLNKNHKELGFYSHGVLFIGQFKSKLILVCTPAVLCQLDIVDYICIQCSHRRGNFILHIPHNGEYCSACEQSSNASVALEQLSEQASA